MAREDTTTNLYYIYTWIKIFYLFAAFIHSGIGGDSISGLSFETRPAVKRFSSDIALAGFNPFGQVFVQLYTVRQRNNEKKSLTLLSLSVSVISLESITHR